MADETNQDSFTPQPETAKRFFDRAGEVALTNNYDYALDLYRDGLKWHPDALEEGHKPLLETGRRRRQSGGKGPDWGDQSNVRKARGDNEKMAWAAYMLAKDPENPKYMEALMQAAAKVNARKAARWAAVMLIESNRDSNRPTLERYLAAVDVLEAVESFDEAVAGCQLACRIRPNDMGLTTRLKNLSAMQTLQRGNYETADSFKGSLINAKKQLEQQQDQSVVSQDAIVDRQIADARRELAATPNQAGKVYALVEALCRRSRESEEDEAVAVLQQAYSETQSYRFRERIGDIRMRRFHRKIADARAALDADPANEDLKRTALEIVRQTRAFEEQEYADRVANYPTDMTLKFEYGRRLFQNGKYDDAIPVLQQAESDAKNRLRAMSLLGQSFFNLGFFNEAVETYRRAISIVELAGSETAKELYYFLGRALEQMGDIGEADKAYSQVVQWDFNYRDTRQRIQKLRQQRRGNEPGGIAPATA